MEVCVDPNRTILLVDDNQILVAAVADLLRNSGYSVLEHTNPLEALECFRRNAEINCIVADIEMPDMDGVSLVAELRRMRPNVEGIFMTGGRHRPGHAEVLLKPFTFAELIQALENVGMALTSQVDNQPGRCASFTSPDLVRSVTATRGAAPSRVRTDTIL
jgi:CheY-like chemotaxis protein